MSAKWIWAEGVGEVNTYAVFEDVFTADGENVYAEVSVSGEYALYINDAFAGFGQYADWPRRKRMNRHDIAPFLRSGGNRFRLCVWHPGIDTQMSVACPAGAWFRVVCGGAAVLESSATTLSRADTRYVSGGGVPLLTSQLGYSFEFNAAKTPAVSAPSVVREGFAMPEPSPIPLLQIEETVRGSLCACGVFHDFEKENRPSVRMQRAALSARLAEELTDQDGWMRAEDSDGIYLICDLGEERAGYLEFELDTLEEADVLIGFGEHLADLRVRTDIDGRNFTAVYHAKAGRNRFFHPFRRWGCRYLQFHIYARAVRPVFIGLRPVHYPVREILRLRGGGAMHEKIYETGVRTLRACMHEHYEDCPWREQGLYAMDSRVQILCGYYAFGETCLPKASLTLLAESLRADGLLEITAPSRVGITIPCFSLAFCVEVYEYLLYSGDRDIDVLFNVALRILDAIEARTDCFGRAERFYGAEYWNFYEWEAGGLDGGEIGKASDPEKHCFEGLLTAWYALALDAVGKCAAILGKEDDLSKRLARTRNALRMFRDPETGLYAAFADDEGRLTTYSALMQALVVLSGGCDESEKPFLLSRLATQEGLTPVTLSDSLPRYLALMTDEPRYADFVFRDIEKVWGKMLLSGATTFWETADGEKAFHNAGSLCHGWSSVPVYFYHAYGQGIRPAEPGVLRQYPTYQSVLGDISFEKLR